ncbi:unnamed protein product [Rhizopus stolonifer]
MDYFNAVGNESSTRLHEFDTILNASPQLTVTSIKIELYESNPVNNRDKEKFSLTRVILSEKADELSLRIGIGPLGLEYIVKEIPLATETCRTQQDYNFLKNMSSFMKYLGHVNPEEVLIYAYHRKSLHIDFYKPSEPIPKLENGTMYPRIEINLYNVYLECYKECAQSQLRNVRLDTIKYLTKLKIRTRYKGDEAESNKVIRDVFALCKMIKTLKYTSSGNLQLFKKIEDERRLFSLLEELSLLEKLAITTEGIFVNYGTKCRQSQLRNFWLDTLNRLLDLEIWADFKDEEVEFNKTIADVFALCKLLKTLKYGKQRHSPTLEDLVLDFYRIDPKVYPTYSRIYPKLKNFTVAIDFNFDKTNQYTTNMPETNLEVIIFILISNKGLKYQQNYKHGRRKFYCQFSYSLRTTEHPLPMALTYSNETGSFVGHPDGRRLKSQ